VRSLKDPLFSPDQQYDLGPPFRWLAPGKDSASGSRGSIKSGGLSPMQWTSWTEFPRHWRIFPVAKRSWPPQLPRPLMRQTYRLPSFLPHFTPN
jgi:hypothetical protein